MHPFVTVTELKVSLPNANSKQLSRGIYFSCRCCKFDRDLAPRDEVVPVNRFATIDAASANEARDEENAAPSIERCNFLRNSESVRYTGCHE